ncbi:histidine phosphatase family protein [Streptococcus thermophilus]|uniref:histidine phosphatase family protein n=1 Tax=Streptococcus thermophilus TaxID=1308 RepID=UPI000230DD9A|nr:histidine phosphatase family protein [Streptococcus thermophilus]EHE87768.1 Phosphoglycerate mutase [Streptococcus thermophilus CNCM I-1630]CDA39735.1 phosphoglycerate mutase [Streptococcus thermophilus CAG:236]MCT1187238.1 histidine phosphatase family protein [Streptococcus thermophilus]MCT2905722.1 histidine phosphatase family protein [Streptococcus thermophilus]MCT2913961.1 histidine phosphatase family protein [Streptococcus thermophilus]
MRLYFVRHGKTQWNLEERLQGSKGDSPLLKESIEQVSELGHYLSDTHFDLVLSSDLPRAKKTTELIMESQKTKAKITYTKDLREWQLGKLEGQKLSIIQAIYPKEMDAFRHNLANFRANNFQAESVYHTTKRVADLVRTLKDSSMENVLLVGHGANLTASIRSLLGFEPGLLRKAGGLDNASVTILETDDCEHFTLKSWNDTSYRTQVNKIS